MKTAKNQIQMGINIGNSNCFRKAHSQEKLDKLKASLRPFRISK